MSRRGKLWKVVALTMLLAVTAFACDDDSGGGGGGGDATDSPLAVCDGVDCSGHGECMVDTNGNPHCICDSGYRADGLSCVEIEPGHECDGVDCSGHGTCVVVQGDPDYPVCICDEGYYAVNDTECVRSGSDGDPCEGQTCSGHGTCVVENGLPRCECDSGYHADGLMCISDTLETPQCSCSVGSKKVLDLESYLQDNGRVKAFAPRVDGPGFALLLAKENHNNRGGSTYKDLSFITWDPATDTVGDLIELPHRPEYWTEGPMYFGPVGSKYVMFYLERGQLYGCVIEADGTQHECQEVGTTYDNIHPTHSPVFVDGRLFISELRVENEVDHADGPCGVGTTYLQEYDEDLNPIGPEVPLNSEQRQLDFVGLVADTMQCYGGLHLKDAAVDGDGKLMVFLAGRSYTSPAGNLILGWDKGVFARETDSGWVVGPDYQLLTQPMDFDLLWGDLGFFYIEQRFPHMGTVDPPQGAMVGEGGELGAFFSVGWEQVPSFGAEEQPQFVSRAQWVECTYLVSEYVQKEQTMILYDVHPLDATAVEIERDDDGWLAPVPGMMSMGPALLYDSSGQAWWIYFNKDENGVVARPVDCQ